MISSILTVLSPAIVSLVTNLLKPNSNVVNFFGYHKTAIRLICAVLSFASVLGLQWSAGQPVDPASIQTLVDALFIFLGAHGVFFLAKSAAVQQ